MNSVLFEKARRFSGIINSRLAQLDRLFLAPQLIELPPPLFILGVPRSGTTLTYQLITQQLRVGYFIEPMNLLFGCPNLILRLAAPFLFRPHPVFVSHFGKTDSPFAPAESGAFWFRWFPRDGELGHYSDPDQLQLGRFQSLLTNIKSMSQITQKPMVFKSVYLDMSAGILAQIMPEARFILVKRNYLHNCQSLLLARQRQRKPDEWWSVKPPHYREWLSQPLWKQVSNQVYATQVIVERDLRKFAAGRFLEITYEQLCARPRELIHELSDWLRPLGYHAFPDMRIPEVFRASSQIRLDDSLTQKFKSHLEILRQRGPS